MARGRNNKIKRPFLTSEFTTEQILEIQRCSYDPIYFIEKYVMIQHPLLGAVPFILYPFQRRMVTAYKENRFTIILASRQVGKSATAAAFLLWYTIFNFDKTVLIASNKNKNAMEIMHRIKFAYEELPDWIKPGALDDGWNKHSVAWDNGSRIESTATSEDSGRGMSISLLYLDEFAFVRPSIQQEFWTSISPTLSTGGSCIVTSTPNGDGNLFAQLWRSAEAGVITKGDFPFVPVRVKWDEPPGRNEKFKREQLAVIGPSRWDQEFECKFLSSDSLLIESFILNDLHRNVVPPVMVKDKVQFFDNIKRGGTYLVGVDPATGSGKDFGVITIYEFPSLKQVGEFRSNAISTTSTYGVLKNILLYIEKVGAMAYFSIERNGIGEGMLTLYINDDNFPEQASMISDSGKNKMGMFTDGPRKRKACLGLKQLVESGKLTARSPELIKELKTFVKRGESYSGQLGATDDCVSATLIVVRLIEEISVYEQEAFDKLYSNASFTVWDSEQQEHTIEPSSNLNDFDPLPFIS